VLFGAATVWAQTSGQAPAASVPDKPGVVYAERARTTAMVTAVDRSQRTVTLQVADGRSVTLKVPPEAKNFDQVRPGDTVRAEYLDAVALVVRKSDEPPQAGEMAAVRLAPKGGQPGGVMVQTVEVTAKVQAIDLAKRTVTLQGPRGGVRVVKVDDRVQGLDQVKPGDEVVVRHTQGLALVLDR
jgi:hypothetical protein